MANHTAAIHVLKAQISLSDDDYRALLVNLTGKASSRDMSDAERQRVRDHMQRLAAGMGVAKPARGAAPAEGRRTQGTPQQRKVWAMWNSLVRAGAIQHGEAKALDAWVARQVGASSLRFCTGAQLNTLIESLKEWQHREGIPW